MKLLKKYRGPAFNKVQNTKLYFIGTFENEPHDNQYFNYVSFVISFRRQMVTSIYNDKQTIKDYGWDIDFDPYDYFRVLFDKIFKGGDPYIKELHYHLSKVK